MSEIEKRHRINAALWAYAYEIMDDPLVSDARYDSVCLSINPSIKTGHLDDFFSEEFNPSTGMWIYKHPEIMGLATIYQRLTGKPAKHISKYKNECPPVTKNVSNIGFKTQTDMKIYIASLGLRVLGHTLLGGEYGRLDFEFDRDFFHVTQHDTGISKSISYKEYFNRPGVQE